MSQPLSQLLCFPYRSNIFVEFQCTHMQPLKHVLDFRGRVSREISHAFLDGERQTALIYFWGIGSLTIAPPCVCSASHLSGKGQGMQTSHIAHRWQECLILKSLISDKLAQVRESSEPDIYLSPYFSCLAFFSLSVSWAQNENICFVKTRF